MGGRAAPHKKGGEELARCAWSLSADVCTPYHDLEWGVPVHEDRLHFEFILLDAFQAGLSWSTILRKRPAFRKAFADFDPARVARFDGNAVKRLMAEQGIIRNRQKIESAARNARAFLRVQEEFGSFDDYVWRFVNGETRANAWKRESEIPAKTEESESMSRDLKSRGFSFVGPTICYAYMQASGLVNDHVVDCFRYTEINAFRRSFVRQVSVTENLP